MTLVKHAALFVYSFVTWLTFYLIGLPDYYQQWPLWSKIVLVAFVSWMYFPVTRASLRQFWDDGEHARNARWLGFYLTVPFFGYDYLLLAVWKGLGIGFVVPYWYLTFFYFSFWIQFPWVARRMEQEEAAVDLAA